MIRDIGEMEKGIEIAVSDGEIVGAVQEWAQTEGIFAAPEGAASLVAYQKLRARNFLTENDVTVLFNTGSGIKYVDVIAAAQEDAAKKDAQKSPASQPATRNIGGITWPQLSCSLLFDKFYVSCFAPPPTPT